jgi:hypothetical protein
LLLGLQLLEGEGAVCFEEGLWTFGGGVALVEVVRLFGLAVWRGLVER